MVNILPFPGKTSRKWKKNVISGFSSSKKKRDRQDEEERSPFATKKGNANAYSEYAGFRLSLKLRRTIQKRTAPGLEAGGGPMICFVSSEPDYLDSLSFC